MGDKDKSVVPDLKFNIEELGIIKAALVSHAAVLVRRQTKETNPQIRKIIADDVTKIDQLGNRIYSLELEF